MVVEVPVEQWHRPRDLQKDSIALTLAFRI